jgi:hypothetical protein
MRRFFDIASVLVCQLRQYVSALNPVWDVRKYRPERHYMRGPGPKWREKHFLSRLPVADEQAMPRHRVSGFG